MLQASEVRETNVNLAITSISKGGHPAPRNEDITYRELWR